jgi:hypothetical protein
MGRPATGEFSAEQGEYIVFPEAKPARDPFTFSLCGMAAVNSHAVVPAVANDGINRARDARRNGLPARRPQLGPSSTTRQIETLLARYFAQGCGCAA